MKNPELNHNIQNQVDLMLFEEGSFSPLNWLLKEGYLEFADYQQWRQGRIEYLEDHFKVSTPKLIQALEMVKAYAESQDFKKSSLPYTSTSNRPLHCCRSVENELVFITVYQPAQNRIQLDLFFDSASVCIESDLIKAIFDKRNNKISALQGKLKTSNPEKHTLFCQLFDFEKTITQTHETSDKKIQLLTEKITPFAIEVLGHFAHEFLTPLWRILSEEIADLHFHAEWPENHLSYTAFKGFQWHQVISSIEREKNWAQESILVFRYAEACFKLKKEAEGLINWFSLFIGFSKTAEQWLAETSNYLLLADWRYFSELDPELEPSLFPAWLLLIKPALVNSMVQLNPDKFTQLLDNSYPMQLITNLITNNNELNKTAIHLRTQLQHHFPTLFVHYMRKNEGKQEKS